MVISVSKIGTGTEIDPIRPDTTSTWWRLIYESDTTMTIEILDEIV